MDSQLTNQDIELDAAIAVIEYRHSFAENLRAESHRVAVSNGKKVNKVNVGHVKRALPAALNATLESITIHTDVDVTHNGGRRKTA